MNYLNLTKGLATAVAAAFIFSACNKVDTPQPIGDAGQTIVKLLEVDFKTINIDLVNTSQLLRMVDIRRDVPNAAELDKTMTIVIKDDPGAVTSYNAANGTAFVAIPSNLYTIDPSNPRIGNNYSIVLKPGEIGKTLNISLPNALALDLNLTYAFGFSIVSVDANGHIAKEARQIVVQVGVKNKWDGKYSITWTNYHPTSNPGYTGGTTDVEMWTTGANKVKMFFPAGGAFAAPSILGGSLSYFGAQEPEYTINTATNDVTVQNSYAGAVTFYTMAPGFNSRYEDATKTFYVKYGYNYSPGPVFNAATTREWTQTIKYTGPR